MSGLAHKQGLHASVRRKFGGWVIEIWEEGHHQPVADFPQDKQPTYKDKMAAINAVLGRRRDAAIKDQAWEAFDRRCAEDDAKQK